MNNLKSGLKKMLSTKMLIVFLIAVILRALLYAFDAGVFVYAFQVESFVNAVIIIAMVQLSFSWGEARSSENLKHKILDLIIIGAFSIFICFLVEPLSVFLFYGTMCSLILGNIKNPSYGKSKRVWLSIITLLVFVILTGLSLLFIWILLAIGG